MRFFRKVEVLMPPEAWKVPEIKAGQLTYAEKIAIIDQILVPLPKIEVRA